MNQMQGLYGSAVICFTADREQLHSIRQTGSAGTFYSIILMVDGWENYLVNNNMVKIELNDIFVSLPFSTVAFDSCSGEVSSMHLMIEKNYFDDLILHNDLLRESSPIEIFSTIPVFRLGETKAASFYQSFDNIRRTIIHPHLYKDEMIKYQLNICLLMLAELVSGHEVNTHDLKYKDNILRIFLHLASRHFRKERQIQFYADRLNISPTYLSRTIKELTGNTVFGYLSNFLYSDICIQLRTTDKPISEIAADLSFSDQSALTNFFRTKSGMSPLAYRRNKATPQ